MNRVSVIVPVYNVGEILEKCIESIMAQTYTDWELWLIDDGSKDISGEICDKYAKCDSRVHVIHKENEGVSSTRNMGLKKAIGEYVMFIDGDDYLEHNALEEMMWAVDKYNADVVMCGFFYHFEENGVIEPNYIKEMFVGGNDRFVSDLFREVFGKELLNPPWNKVIRKSLLERSNIKFVLDFSICEDMIFTMDVLKESNKIIFLNMPLYHYIYKRGENLVNKYHENYYEALSAYYDRVSSYLEINDASDEVYLDVNKFFVDKTISYFRKIYSHDSDEKPTKYCQLKRICKDLRDREMFYEYKPVGIKKKVVRACIKYRWYWLLHLLYVCV